jgi:nitrogen fixation protein NifU and related proteins
VIRDHGRRPRNFGEIAGARRAERDNPLCGDRAIVFVELTGERLGALAFTGEGCSIVLASASMMTERLAGRTREEAEALVERFHGLLATGIERPGLDGLEAFAAVRGFPGRALCAALPWQTLQDALAPVKG